MPTMMAGAYLALVRAAGGLDVTAVSRIREESFTRSQAMATLAQLSDAIGPRLTGTPQLHQAGEWSRQSVEAWGRPVQGSSFWPHVPDSPSVDRRISSKSAAGRPARRALRRHS